MKKFIFFFLLSFYSYAENKESKKILDHIKYLSQRRIIQNVQIDERAFLNKGEFITTLHRLLKVIDKSKVSKEDLNIIENMLYEITTFINKFKVEIDNNFKKSEQLKEEFNNLKIELLEKIEENLSKIASLEKTLKNQFEMESSLKEFLKEYKVNFTNDLIIFSDLYYYQEFNFKWNILTKISKGKSNFKFLYNKEISKDSIIEFKGKVFPIDHFSIYIKNYSHTFVSPFNEIFYYDYINYSKIVGVKSYNIFDISLIKDNNLNLLTNIDIKYFFISSHIFAENTNYIIHYKFLESGVKVPLFKENLWLGAALIKEEDKGYLADFYLAYLSDFLNLKFYYKDNFSLKDRKRKLKVNTNYIFSQEFILGIRGIINFPNIDPTIDQILEAWEIFINTKTNILDLDLSLNSRRLDNRNEIFVVINSNLKYSNFDSKLGFILKDPIDKTRHYRFCLFFKSEYFIYDNLNIYLQYVKSNFKYHNDEMNLEGKRYNTTFNKIRETIEKNKIGIFSLGFKLNI